VFFVTPYTIVLAILPIELIALNHKLGYTMQRLPCQFREIEKGKDERIRTAAKDEAFLLRHY
jgi:hypothetical protein